MINITKKPARVDIVIRSVTFVLLLGQSCSLVIGKIFLDERGNFVADVLEEVFNISNPAVLLNFKL